jgi:multimeric flavodoxin WrbA
MKMLAVVGSPRKRGNTDMLVDEVIRGARQAGSAVEKVFLADLKIEPCDGCDACRKSPQCVHRDDMTALYDSMLESDVWVLGTPVYWWGPSAQLKAFIDRWYMLGRESYRPLQGKRAALVATFADDDPRTARHVLGMLEDAFDYLEMSFEDQLLVTAGDRGEVASNRDALERARALGRKLASGR